jgi:Glycosyltransferase Family 4
MTDYRSMRILLVAHDFPPIASPQALRWRYIVNELVRMGHDVTVICATELNSRGSEDHRVQGCRVEAVPDASVLTTAFALLRRLRTSYRWRGPLSSPSGPATKGSSVRLRWVRRYLRVVDAFRFPDHRRAWLRPARHALRAILASNRPDLVILSHEPAVGLMLARECAESRLPWIADLGDPVLTSYTLRRWRRASLRLEKTVCAGASALIVTNEATANLLRMRHLTEGKPIVVIPQGFDPARSGVASDLRSYSGDNCLRLLYTGRLYRFRSGRELFAAVLRVPGIVLELAVSEPSAEVVALASEYPDKFHLLGAVPHEAALALQADADVLVNLGNADATQTPGKIYEYLGSGKPILHVSQSESDAVNVLLNDLARGWSVAADVDALTDTLHNLRALKTRGQLGLGLDLSSASVSSHTWASRARSVSALCASVLGGACK